MFSEKWNREIFTIPNLLSLFRIALIPLYMTIYLHATRDFHYFLAGALLTLSCITDIADGFIARKCGKITNLGKILDPLADKLTQLTLLLCLAAKHMILYPMLVLFLVKEVFQCSALLFFAQKGKVLPGALISGKICTTVLFVTLILLVLFPRIPAGIVYILVLADTGILLYAFAGYLTAYFGEQNCLTDWQQEP